MTLTQGSIIIKGYQRKALNQMSLSPFQIRLQNATFQEKLEASNQFGRRLEHLISSYGNSKNNFQSTYLENYKIQYAGEMERIKAKIEEMRIDNPAVVNSYTIDIDF